MKECYIDPSKEARPAFRKRICSHVPKDHYRKIARREDRHLSSHEKILRFNQPVVAVRHGDKPKCSRLLKCEQSRGNVPSESSQAPSSLENSAIQDDFVEMQKQELTSAISVLEATEELCRCSSTKLIFYGRCENISPSLLLEDPTDELNTYCRRLGESVSDALVSFQFGLNTADRS